MKCTELRDYYVDFIHNGTVELTVSEKKTEDRAFRDFIKRVLVMRVFQG